MPETNSTFQQLALIPTLFDWTPRISLPVDSTDSGKLFAIREDWLSKLKLMATRSEIDSPPTEKQIEEFARYLVENQFRKSAEDCSLHGSWSLLKSAEAPSDARVDFIYFPSYTAVSYLSLIKQDYPSIAGAIAGFDECLRLGFKFIVGRNLSGHGFEGTEQLLQAVNYLAIGKAFTYARTDAAIWPRFQRAVLKAKKEIRDNIRDPNRPTWSSVDISEGKKGIALLNGRDHEYKRIRDIVFHDWIRRDTAFAHDLVWEISQLIYQNIKDAVKSEMNRAMGLVGADIDADRPKYSVFERSPRRVETQSRCLDISCNVEAFARDLRSHRAYMTDRFLRKNFSKVQRVMKEDIERRLFGVLADIKEIDREQVFEMVVSDICINENGGVELRVCGKDF